MSTLTPDFSHLFSLSDDQGTFEHAEFAVARKAHGYCTDDVARVLVVTSSEPSPSPALTQLARSSLRFVAAAQSWTGECRNRRDATGRWRDAPSLSDCWGRSLWGLGVAVSSGDDWLENRALNLFERGASRRSPWLRATAFSVLGAAAVLRTRPQNRSARALLVDATEQLDVKVTSSDWAWPEARLTYANAVLPDALVAIGVAQEDSRLIEQGLEMLSWLLERETLHGHLSVTPVGGAGPGDVAGRFDQQPIEVAAMADACTRAYVVTGQRRWADAVSLCHDWFTGENDLAQPMYDPLTGGGYDGLQAHGPNLNQGAESSLALLSTIQRARSLASVDR